MSYFDSIMQHCSGLIYIRCPNAENPDATEAEYEGKTYTQFEGT